MIRAKVQSHFSFKWCFLASIPNALFVYSAALSVRNTNKALETMPADERKELYKRDYLLKNNPLYHSYDCFLRRMAIDSYRSSFFSKEDHQKADDYAESRHAADLQNK